MKKLLFLLSVVLSTLLLHAQTNQVVWLNGKVYYQQPVTAIDSITYDMNNMITGDTLQLILPRATQQNPPSTITPKVKLLDAQTNQVVWLNGKVYYQQPVTAIDSITYDMNNMLTGDTLKLIMPRATREIVYKEIHDTIIKEIHDTVYIDRLDENLLAGVFSVSADKQVAFSRGNLQYRQSTATWSFTETQYDMLGEANVSGSALADKIDLFGWSGSTGSAQWGISTSTSYSDYSGDFVDWGTNTIGTAAPNTYRTLTNDEWAYLLNTRTNASEKKGVARINFNSDGTQYANGLILLPDSWTCPAGITFKSGFASELHIEAYATYQTFTLAEWQQLENAGAVFLPATGNRFGSSIFNVHYGGHCWSATAYGSNHAYFLYFHSNEAIESRYTDRRSGRAVRLVKDL